MKSVPLDSRIGYSPETSSSGPRKRHRVFGDASLHTEPSSTFPYILMYHIVDCFAVGFGDGQSHILILKMYFYHEMPHTLRLRWRLLGGKATCIQNFVKATFDLWNLNINRLYLNGQICEIELDFILLHITLMLNSETELVLKEKLISCASCSLLCEDMLWHKAARLKRNHNQYRREHVTCSRNAKTNWMLNKVTNAFDKLICFECFEGHNQRYDGEQHIAMRRRRNVLPATESEFVALDNSQPHALTDSSFAKRLGNQFKRARRKVKAATTKTTQFVGQSMLSSCEHTSLLHV